MKTFKKIFHIFLIFGFLEIFQCEPDADDIPIDFKPCAEENLDDCFRELMQSELASKINGSEKLNLPPLEPLEIEKQRFNYTGQNGIEMAMIIENVKLHGFTASKFKNVRTSLSEKGLRVAFEVFTPRLEALGNYKANVKFNELKIRPKGEFNVTITDLHNVIKVTNEFETVNDKKFLQMKNVSLDPKVGDIKFNATGIFPDPVLNEITVQMINRYLSNFYKLILSESQSIWEPLLITTTNDFLKKVPFDRFVAEGKKGTK